MTEDDDRPRAAKPILKDLEPLSLAELDAYIAGLEAEIYRARHAIEAKRGHRGGAEAIFRR